MSLIRGIKSLFPCPICLVPRDKLSDLSQVYELRTQKNSEALVRDTQGMTMADAEQKLRNQSLRPVQVCRLLQLQCLTCSEKARQRLTRY